MFLLYLSHLGIPPVRFLESFVKIRLDLAEIMLIKKSLYFVCLFVCLFFGFVYLNRLGIPSRRFPGSVMKIGLDLAEILLV